MFIYSRVLDVMTELIKAFHLIVVMLLIGGTITAIYLQIKTPQHWLIWRSRLLRALLWLLLLAGVTGTMLVHPRHFTFHTHWIIAAYILLLLCGGVLQYPKLMQHTETSILRGIWLERTALLLTMASFVLIVHDAVTKQTFF